MLETGAHFGYVFAAYAATFIIFSSLVITITLDAKTQKKRLDKLTESGLTRRSEEN